jgi:hypothetical protein
MPDSQNDNSSNQPVPENVLKETIIYEDEINLIDYFLVLWKHKFLILLGSVLPTLVVGLMFFFSPRSYEITYIYDVGDRSVYDIKDQVISSDISNWSLDEKNYELLLDRFYSAENVDKIMNKLRESGLNKQASQISNAGDNLTKTLKFNVLPPYPDLSKTKAKATGSTELERNGQLKAQLLKLTITGKPKSDFLKASLVIRDNFENVIPVYLITDQLNIAKRQCNTDIASIEANRFDHELELKTSRAILAKMKNAGNSTSEENLGNILLQLDISDKTEYLPVEYQSQALESKIIKLEEQSKADGDKVSYCKELLILYEKLLVEIKSKATSYYTIQQFHSFLMSMIDDYKDKKPKDYLNSYIKKIENRISISAPVTEQPKVYFVAKGTKKKSAVVFAASLTISVLASLLIEGLKKARHKSNKN